MHVIAEHLFPERNRLVDWHGYINLFKDSFPSKLLFFFFGHFIFERINLSPNAILPIVFFFIFPSLIHFLVLRHVHNLFRSEFSTEVDLVLPFSISSIFSFP